MQTFSYSLLGIPLEEMLDQDRFPVSFKTIQEEIPLILSFYIWWKKMLSTIQVFQVVFIFSTFLSSVYML